MSSSQISSGSHSVLEFAIIGSVAAFSSFVLHGFPTKSGVTHKRTSWHPLSAYFHILVTGYPFWAPKQPFPSPCWLSGNEKRTVPYEPDPSKKPNGMTPPKTTHASPPVHVQHPYPGCQSFIPLLVAASAASQRLPIARGLQRVIKTVDTSKLSQRLLDSMRREIQAAWARCAWARGCGQATATNPSGEKRLPVVCLKWGGHFEGSKFGWGGVEGEN